METRRSTSAVWPRFVVSLFALLLAGGVPDDGADSETGDLAAIRGRGTLRVLVENLEEGYLPRQGHARALERELITEFAQRHGLKTAFVLAPGYSQLIPMLVAGHGDVIVASMTKTAEREQLVSFTRPTASVSEILVGRAGADVPATVSALAGRKVHVRASSSFAASLSKLVSDGIAVEIVPSPEHLDPFELAAEIARGTRPLTVVDSNLLPEITSVVDGLQAGAVVADGRQTAWGVRKSSTELRAALDAFVVERFLTAASEARSTGALEALRRRGSLRVLTRNGAVTYYLHRGERFGFDFEIARLVAKQLGLRLEMVVPPTREALVPWLLEGRGDLIGASFGVSDERAKQVAFSAPYLFHDEVVVQRVKGRKKIRTHAALAKTRIHVAPGSTTAALMRRLQGIHGPFELVDLPPDTDPERAIELVAKGTIDFTVVGSHLLRAELAWRHDVEAGAVLTEPDSAAVAFAARPDNPALLAAVDDAVKKLYRGLEYNMAKKRYFENVAQIRRAKQSLAPGQPLSPYDALIRRLSKQYGLDWRLMAAQAYQESEFDPAAKSWVGAEGLFQVMPATGKSLGFTRLHDPEQGAHAGIKYMHRLLQQLDPSIPLKHRLRFALASYNAGLGHVLDAQVLAVQLGLDPKKWFKNVEKAMLLLEQPKYARVARHGYCRGSEPVKYVSEIQNRYDAYVKVVKD